jgi:lysozyme-like protein
LGQIQTSQGPQYTIEELQDLAAGAGFPASAIPTVAAIAMAESGGYQYAQGDPQGTFSSTPNGTSTSFGLWQVHTPAHPEYSAASLLSSASYSASAAYAISSSGTNFVPWSTYNSGAYQQYVSAYVPSGSDITLAAGIFVGAGALAYWLANQPFYQRLVRRAF